MRKVLGAENEGWGVKLQGLGEIGRKKMVKK